MPSPLALAASFVITFLVLFGLRPVANKIKLMDYPGGRKDHSHATPLVGGIGIYFGLLLTSFFTSDLMYYYAPLLTISFLVLIVGIRDDYREMSASIRIGTQVLAASLMFILAGNPLNSVGDLVFIGPIGLGILALPITAFATVGVINAVNMSDGLDGLCSGMVFIALAFLGSISYQQEHLIQAGFIAILGCCLLAYFTLNFRQPWKLPAMIYLGDAGSTFIGFVLAWLLIESTQGDNAIMPPVLALWLIALPLMDTVMLLVKRPLEGISPFAPGRDHLHHKLLAYGLSKATVLFFLLALEIILGLIGLYAYRQGVSESVLFTGFLGLFVIYLGLMKYCLNKTDISPA